MSFRGVVDGVKLAVVALCAASTASIPVAEARPGGGGGIKSHEYSTERNGIKIALYEKFAPGEEKNWKQNGKVILLVHGATWSSRCTFDPVEDYSFMDALARAGYDVWAVDLHGYGRSDKTTRDWTESASAAADVEVAADFIRALRWVERVHVFGYQWGAQPVAQFASAHANKVGKLILFGMRYNLFDKKPAPAEQYRANSSSHALLKPEDGDLEPDFVRRRAQVCMQYDQKSPNGALIDLAQRSAVNPASIKNPTLLIMGERDTDDATLGDRLDFFRALGAHSRVFAVLSGLGKYASFERGRARFESAVVDFLDAP
jgi:pimeloyl-ACP methyl ester carboxylesterase